MALKTATIVFVIIQFQLCFAQNRNELSFDVNVNVCNFSMKSLNAYLTRPKFTDNYVNPNGFGKKIEFGTQIKVDLDYRISEIVSLGIYVGHQFCEKKTEFSWPYSPDPLNSPEVKIPNNGFNTVRVSATTIGVSSKLYFNKLFQKAENNSKFRARTSLYLGINGGYGLCNFKDIAGFLDSNPYTFRLIDTRANNIHLTTDINASYRFHKKVFFSEIGIKIGFQYLKTKAMNSFFGTPLDIESEESTNLDFSGIYYGIYLKLGK